MSLGNLSSIIIPNASSSNATANLPPGLTSASIEGYLVQRSSLISRLNTTGVAAYEIINNNSGSLTISLMHPLSRGTTGINSSDPFTPPYVDPRWLTDPTDRAIMVAAMLFNRELLATPSMQRLQPVQFVPGPDDSLAKIEQIINNGIRTEFHVSGTTAMAPTDQGGVVDNRAKVFGTQNLRVVDAGIIPIIPAGHLQAPVYAIAEMVSPFHTRILPLSYPYTSHGLRETPLFGAFV